VDFSQNIKSAFVSVFGMLNMWKVVSVLHETEKFLKKTKQRIQTVFVQYQTQALVGMRAIYKLVSAF